MMNFAWSFLLDYVVVEGDIKMTVADMVGLQQGGHYHHSHLRLAGTGMAGALPSRPPYRQRQQRTPRGVGAVTPIIPARKNKHHVYTASAVL